MTYFWWHGVDVKLLDHFLYRNVFLRESLVLAEVLGPGCHHKEFYLPLRLGDVGEHPYPQGTVAEPYPLERFGGLQKSRQRLRINAVLDHDYDRAIVG
jgi:hypothetical protein